MSHEKLHLRPDTTKATGLGKAVGAISKSRLWFLRRRDDSFCRLGYTSSARCSIGRRHSQLISRDNLLVVTVTMVGVAVVVIILHEEVLVCAVASESDSRDSEAREETLETVESAEGAGVAPGLTINY